MMTTEELELRDAFDQLARCGGGCESSLVMELINVVVEINDNLAHSRSRACTQEEVEKAKGLLDRIVSGIPVRLGAK